MLKSNQKDDLELFAEMYCECKIKVLVLDKIRSTSKFKCDMKMTYVDGLL